MSFLDFAAAHPVLAVIFALLALCVVVAPVSIVCSYLRDRLPLFGPEDRGAMTQAAAFLRLNAQQYDHDDYRRSKREEAAEKLERMASR